MFKFTSSQIKLVLPVILSLLVSTVITNTAIAATSALATDLQDLVAQGNNVNTQLSATSLNIDNSCTELGSAIASVEAFITAVEAVSGNLSAPLSLDVDSITALDDLSIVSTNIASVLPVLSADISAISTNSDLADIQAALDTMLKLSDDIGLMADRILEMADKILLMADNIGLMADRILLTQQIQSSNLALTQAFMLSTQENMITLSVTVDTSDYNNTLNNLTSTGNVLSLDMNNTQLTESNMNTVLADFENRVDDYRSSVMLMFNIVNSDSRIASHYINSDTLTMLGDLSVINAALANSLNQFSQSVEVLAPDTDIAVLNDSVYSMLRLASDIGLMAGRLVEMGDDINIMADNIGAMAVRIVDTQTLQQSNLDLTQSNLSTARITTITVISVFGL
ncbi:MAG: hypothetical protein GQ572_01395 [Gammaproteobacteria bacterium]|nr:hypothetical protein [Gammaproteobacteria bacterium]